MPRTSAAVQHAPCYRAEVLASLGLVATRRSSWLWLGAVGALGLAGCSAGQTIPPTTRSGVPPTSQARTVTATGAITGEACGSLDASQSRVTIDLDKPPVSYNLKTLQAVTVPLNDNYRFTSIVPGRYVLLGLWPSDPPDETVIRVVAGETRIMNLGACVPTVAGKYRPASLVAVRAFLARASEGDNQTFSATYRFIATFPPDMANGANWSRGYPKAGLTFSFAQEPHGGRYSLQAWGAGDFAYLARYRGQSLKFVQRDSRDYECLRATATARWSCDSTKWEDIGNSLTVLTYDEQAGLEQGMANALTHAFISTETLSSLPVTCLRYHLNDGSRATWCITAHGITAFAAAAGGSMVEMVRLSPSLPPGMFSLPARPTSAGFKPWPASLAVSSCMPAQIEARQGHQVGGATGEGAMLITLSNRGPGPCVLDGYPQVRLVTSTNAVLDLPQVRHSQYVTAASPRPVTLEMGKTAYVLVAQYRCDLGDAHQASGARLTMPGAAAALSVQTGSTSLPLALCKGGATDPGNVIAVTPIEATPAATVP